MEATKKCCKCKVFKHVCEFTRDKTRHDGLNHYCKECNNAKRKTWNSENPDIRKVYASEWKKKNSDKTSGYARKARYGLTREDYTAKLEAQGYKCECCDEPLTLGKSRNTHVDHDHESGQVRGILCRACNLMLGHARDNPEVLLKGATYLEAYQETPNVDRR